MKLILLLGHLVITGPCDCVLAHTSAVGQQLVSDTSLQKFTTMCLMGMCVLEKMSLKRPWSKLQLIKELLICMFQICWNNWGNFSSFQASAITHPGSSQVLQSVGWWRVANVSGKGNSGCCLCSSCPQPCLKAELCWTKAGPDPWHTVCHVPQGSEWSLLTWVMLPSQDAPPPCVQDPGRLWGTARIWEVFSQRYYKFLQCELLMFSKTQAERTS